jgi:hypothetical protein
MAQLAIEIPDALLPELEQRRSQLPLLLTQWVKASLIASPELFMAHQEVLSFLLAQPTAQGYFAGEPKQETSLGLGFDSPQPATSEFEG